MKARIVRICRLALATPLAVGAMCAAQPAPSTGVQQPTPMDRQREIALALSACPASLADGAAVYVLEKSGYVKVREGGNGFTAIVQHAVPTSQEPQCMDAEGARTILPRILMTAELRSQGKSREEIKLAVADAFAQGVLQPPARPGIDYMLSTEILTPDAKGNVRLFPPHVMVYAPYLTNAEIGLDGDQEGPLFVGLEGTPHALLIIPIVKSRALSTGANSKH